jgi:hypothetical protein
MSKSLATFSLSILSASAVLLWRCTLGGGTEDVNTRVVTGMVFNPDSTPASLAQVQLIPADYDPMRDARGSILTDTTDDAGEYRFTMRESGLYTAQIVQIAARTRAIVARVAVQDDTTAFPPAELSKPGSIKIVLPDSIDKASGYVYIPGTTIASQFGEADEFALLDSVPAGTVPSVNYGAPVSVPRAIRYDVPVASAETTTVAQFAWKYAARCALNTTPTGADVAGNVMNFPALVRLNNDNFTFTQALTNGDDICFTKENGSPLAYEIELWDAAIGKAVIWVNVDTVYGNDSSHYFIMYWGNPDASGNSNGTAVFDTAAGFAGVWHLNENGENVVDATGNACHGRNSGSTAVAGIIGNARNFANGNHIRVSGLLMSPPNVTLSAWVRSDTSLARGQDIVSIGDAVLIRFDDILGMGTAGCYHNTALVNDSNYARVQSGRYLAKTGWHYLVFSVDAETHAQTLYIDGVQSAVSHDVNPINYAGLGADTYFGIHGNGKTGFNFIGRIDEVRVNSIAPDPEWIKLCFMNQKEQDALIRW